MRRSGLEVVSYLLPGFGNVTPLVIARRRPQAMPQLDLAARDFYFGVTDVVLAPAKVRRPTRSPTKSCTTNACKKSLLEVEQQTSQKLKT